MFRAILCAASLGLSMAWTGKTVPTRGTGNDYTVGEDDNPTLAPIVGTYERENFNVYLTFEQSQAGAPGNLGAQLSTTNRPSPIDLSGNNPAAADCVRHYLLAILPGIRHENIEFNVTNKKLVTYTNTFGIKQNTMEINIDYVPVALGFYQNNGGAVNANEPTSVKNTHMVNSNAPNGGFTNNAKNYKLTGSAQWKDYYNSRISRDGWNGLYKEDGNCRDCWDNTHTLFLQYKDIITERVAKKEFVKDLRDSVNPVCKAQFAAVQYVYVKFGAPKADVEGFWPASKSHDDSYQYIYILFGLLLPVGVLTYLYIYQPQGQSVFNADYLKEKQAECLDPVASPSAPANEASAVDGAAAV